MTSPDPTPPSRRAPPSRRDAYRWQRSVDTRWHDNDAFGHVNNVVYYEFCDTVVNRFLIEVCGFDPFGSDVLDFTVESGCRFHRPLAYPDRVTVAIRIARLGGSSLRWEWGVFRNDEAEASAEGHFVHVFVDRATQRPVPIPSLLRNHLETIQVAS